MVGADHRPVDAVVVGGHSGFDYDELVAATSAVRAGALLWATGRDATYPTPDGLVPGTGALVAAVETASETRARVAGKPERPMFEAAKRRLGGDRMAMVGDTLDADIAGAQRAGWPRSSYSVAEPPTRNSSGRRSSPTSCSRTSPRCAPRLAGP